MSHSSDSRISIAIAGLVALGAVPMSLRAQALPPAAFEVAVSGNPVSFAPGTLQETNGGAGLGNGTAASAATATTGLSLAASAMVLDPADASLPASGTASAEVTYYVGVYGPQANLAVPLTITASVSSGANDATGTGTGGGVGDAGAYIKWFANNSANPVGEIDVGVNCSTSACTYNDFTLNVPGVPAEGTSAGLSVVNVPYTINSTATSNTTPNSSNAVFMFVAALAESGTGSWTAAADPVIQIDPTWLAENPGYALVISSNVAPVPLPGTWLLLLGGIAGLALWPWSKRQGTSFTR